MVQALDICEELGDRTNIATFLDALATRAATAGNVRRSLLLAGAAERIRTEIEGGVPTGAVPLTDWREIVAESLTDEEIEAGLDAGRQLTSEGALAEAHGLEGAPRATAYTRRHVVAVGLPHEAVGEAGAWTRGLVDALRTHRRGT